MQIDLEDVQSVNKHVTMYYLPSFAFLCVYSKVLVETGKLKKCACGEARYCSPHCQFYHWFNYEDAHKERCEEIRKAKEGK